MVTNRYAPWPCDRSLCDKPAEFVCFAQPDDLFRACAEHADGYDRVTVEEYRRGGPVPTPTAPSASIGAAFYAGTQWGRIARRGRWHAFRQDVFEEGRWVPACNRHARYTDMQLAELDDSPGRGICRQDACAMAYTNYRRYADGR